MDTLLGNYKISTRLWSLMGVLVVLATIAVIVFASVLNQVRINGDRYREIIDAKDLTADVLPPPLYVVEANLILHEIALGYEQEESAEHLEDIAVLRAEYERRLKVWLASDIDPETRAALENATRWARSYFATVEGQFSEAALDFQEASSRQERRQAKRAMITLLTSSLEPAYGRHRASIDEVVKLSRASVADAEKAAASDLSRSRTLLLLVGLGTLVLAGLLGVATVRSIVSRVAALRRSADVDFPKVVDQVKRSAEAGEDIAEYVPVMVSRNDELGDAERAFNGVVGTAVELAADQARLRQSTSEMFINLGRRNHKLLSRTLSKISELERAERDPGTLQNLFSLDHLITRMRRNAESLLVLAGTTPMRTWAQAVPVDDVLRAALSEVESYERVRVQLTDPADVTGAAASDVAHLLAELVENAISFSSPETSVSITGGPDHGGYVLYISDEGLGIDSQQLRVLNSRLKAHQGIGSMQDSRRLGLNVVARLAARHGIEVELSQNSVGGVLVRVWLPSVVVGGLPEAVSSAGFGRLVPDPSVVPIPEQLDRPTPARSEELSPAAFASSDDTAPTPDVLRALVSSEGPFQPEETSVGTSPELSVVADYDPGPLLAGSVDSKPADQRDETSADSADDHRPAASPVQLTSGGLPRRVRGTNVNESLRVPPTDADPGARSPEEVRTALANFSSGRKQAFGESDEAESASSPSREREAVAVVAAVSQPVTTGGLTKRVRGANLAESVRTPTAVTETEVTTRSPEQVRSSLADFAAGKLAAAENSGSPKKGEDSSS
ncbi:MAG: ATP-binding protein [Nocardioides sp.]